MRTILHQFHMNRTDLNAPFFRLPLTSREQSTFLVIIYRRSSYN